MGEKKGKGWRVEEERKEERKGEVKNSEDKRRGVMGLNNERRCPHEVLSEGHRKYNINLKWKCSA